MPEKPAAGDRIDPLHPYHDPVCLNRAHTAIVAEWPAGTYLENLARDPDGRSWLVTSPSDQAIYRVSPAGSVTVAAHFDRTPTGIVAHPVMGALTAAGTQGQPDWQLYRITATGAQPVCGLPDVLGGNGMVWSGDRLLVADSGRSVIVAVDVTAGSADLWLQHPLLTPGDAQSPLPGINGLDIHGGWVVMSSSDRGMILRVPAASKKPAADLEVLAEHLVGDDFAIAPDGRIFIATHTYHSVLCLYPDGSREDIADHTDGVAGPTAVAIADGPSPALYVTTSGGLLSPPVGGDVEPARLLRIDALPTESNA
jgi:hypothetical protein